MRSKLEILLFIMLIPFQFFGQQSLAYAYDNSGNRVGRSIVFNTQIKNINNMHDSTYFEEGAYQSFHDGNPVYKSIFYHEYGHILQARKVGLSTFYRIIGPESLFSATLGSFNSSCNHNYFWTETWANYLSYNYFKLSTEILNNAKWPALNISKFNWERLIADPNALW